VTLVQAATVVGLVFVAFGANYTHVLLYLLLGPTWGATAAPSVLAWYCVYVLIMGVNGITEGRPCTPISAATRAYSVPSDPGAGPHIAFLYATGSQRQMHDLNRYLVVFAVIFTALAYVLIGVRTCMRLLLCLVGLTMGALQWLGTAGLVLANCVNMLLRIAYATRYLQQVRRAALPAGTRKASHMTPPVAHSTLRVSRRHCGGRTCW
jgi:oligosaccharide translocation protein RFT1